MENKKVLLLTILGVLILIIAVIGVSFAMFTFTGTGTKQNVIQTGKVSVEFDDQYCADFTQDCDAGSLLPAGTIMLTNQYPKSDALGLAVTGEGNELTFSVKADITGTMTINYVVYLDDINTDFVTDELSEGEVTALTTKYPGGPTLTNEFIKIQVSKNGSVTLGTSTTGILVSSLAGDDFEIGSGTFTATGRDSFLLKAWLDENYILPKISTGTNAEKTISETYSFKIKVVATQS